MSPETKTALNVLGDISSWSTWIPMIIGVIRFRNLTYSLKSVVALALVSLVIDFISDFSTRENPIVIYTVRIYSVCEFTLLSVFFIGQNSRIAFKRILIAFLFLFICLEIYDFYIQGFVIWDNLSLAVESVIMILYSLVTFYFIMQDMQYPKIASTPQFWVITAILLYFGGNIFVFASSNYFIAQHSGIDRYTWGVHSIIHMAFNILIAAGLWKSKTASQ